MEINWSACWFSGKDTAGPLWNCLSIPPSQFTSYNQWQLLDADKLLLVLQVQTRCIFLENNIKSFKIANPSRSLGRISCLHIAKRIKANFWEIYYSLLSFTGRLQPDSALRAPFIFGDSNTALVAVMHGLLLSVLSPLGFGRNSSSSKGRYYFVMGGSSPGLEVAHPQGLFSVEIGFSIVDSNGLPCLDFSNRAHRT